MGLTLSGDAASVAADALLNLLDGGLLRIFDVDGHQLVELRLGRPAFDGARDGLARSRPIAPGIAQRTGTASFFQAYRANERLVLEGRIGIDLVLDDALLERDTRVVDVEIAYIHPLSA